MTNDYLGSTLDDAPDVRELFDRSLAGEPAFRTAHPAALDAAERGGRRRKARLMAGRGIAVIGCLALVGGIASVTLSGPSAGQPASTTSALAGPTRIPFQQDVTKMEALIRQVAALTPGSTFVPDPALNFHGQTPELVSVEGTVVTASGRYRLVVNDLPAAKLGAPVRTGLPGARACQTALPNEGGVCILGSSNDDIMASSWVSGTQPGRNMVDYSLHLPGQEVMIQFDNLEVDGHGNSSTGPDAAKAGFTYASVSALAKAAGF